MRGKSVKKEEEDDGKEEQQSRSEKGKSVFLSNQDRQALLRKIDKRARRQALKEILKKRQQANNRPNPSNPPIRRIQFMPSELLDTRIFVHQTPEYVHISLKPLFQAKETLAINSYPCPASTCSFEVQLLGPIRIGLLPSNTLKRVMMKQSVTFNTQSGRVWVGKEIHHVGPVQLGGMVRVLLCLASRKFRIYAEGKKIMTGDVPGMLARAERVYFYVELLGSGGVRVLK